MKCLCALIAALGICAAQTTISGGRVFGGAESVLYANAGTTGTTVNKLAKLTGAPSTAVITSTSDTSGIVGVVVAGAGTTGSATIAVAGNAVLTFDATATVAGDYVQNSSTVGGAGHDAGSTCPTSGQVIGIVTQSTAGSTTANVLLRSGLCPSSGSASLTPLNIQLAASPVTLTGAGNDITLYTWTLPGNTLGSTGCLFINGSQQHTTGSGATTYKLWFGATSIQVGSSATNAAVGWSAQICGANSTSAEQLTMITSGFGLTQNAAPAENTTSGVVMKLTAAGTNSDQVTPLLWWVSPVFK